MLRRAMGRAMEKGHVDPEYGPETRPAFGGVTANESACSPMPRMQSIYETVEVLAIEAGCGHAGTQFELRWPTSIQRNEPEC